MCVVVVDSRNAAAETTGSNLCMVTDERTNERTNTPLRRAQLDSGMYVYLTRGAVCRIRIGNSLVVPLSLIIQTRDANDFDTRTTVIQTVRKASVACMCV
jgi:hypothetical protein